MSDQKTESRASTDEQVLQQQYLRALSSFEGIVLGQIDVKNKLGDRLNYSIRAGLIILFVIAFSILVLLLTLSSQVTKISDVVGSMNTNFSSITSRMDEISGYLVSMETQVSQLAEIDGSTQSITNEIEGITGLTNEIEGSVTSIRQQMAGTRQNVESIGLTVGGINQEVQMMNVEMHRLAKPARTMNRIIPFR